MRHRGRVRILAIIGVAVLATFGVAALTVAVRNRRYAKMSRLHLVLRAQQEGVLVFSAPQLGALLTERGEEEIYIQIVRHVLAEGTGAETVRAISLGPQEITVQTRASDQDDLTRQGQAIKDLLVELFPDAELLSSDMIPITVQDLESVRGILRERLRAYGMGRSVVEAQPPDRVLVEVPLRDPEKASPLATPSGSLLLKKTALLEFRAVPRRYAHDDRRPEQRETAGRPVFTFREPTGMEVPTSQVITESPVVLAGRDIEPNSARVVYNPNQATAVVFELTQQAAEKLEDFTRRNIGRFVAVVLDGEMIACPIIEKPIPGGEVQISGGFDGRGGLQRAQDLKILLNAGALPVELEYTESRVVQPSE